MVTLTAVEASYYYVLPFISWLQRYGEQISSCEVGVTNTANRVSRVLKFPSTKALEKFFMKAGHGVELGLKGNWSPAQEAPTRSAINQFINSPSVKAIEGTYRGNPVTHYLDPSTGFNVMADQAGNFVGGHSCPN